MNVNITGNGCVGGVLGVVVKPTVSRVQQTVVYFNNIHVYGSLKAITDNVGAILGKLNYYWDYLAYDIYRCSAQAKIYAGPNATHCGGLVGCSLNATIQSKMQECFFIGHLYDAKKGGVLIGRDFASEVVKNCYANATFHNFKEKVSGIMGSGWANAIGEIGIEVDRCYSVIRLDNCDGATVVPYVATPPVNSKYWAGTNPRYPIKVTNCFYDKSVLPGYDYQGAISIWNDAQWRYQLSDVNFNEFKKDALLALDETGAVPNHIRDFSLYNDKSSSAIAHSGGGINIRWFNKDSLKNEKLTKIES